MDKGILKFDVKTGMKNIIGRDLITDDFIAIYELVKNSYDAYADYVKITFDKDEIIISDNGKGMSKNDLEKKWFAVAYSAKKEGTEDLDLKRESHLNNLKSRRYYAGAKGVGRFSCDRLGSQLDLVTSKVKTSQAFNVKINWGKFEQDAEQSFDSIEIPFEEIKKDILFPRKSSNGTILKITNLNSKWDKRKIFDLRRSLEKLINPFSEENSFKIEIEASNEIKSIKASDNTKIINGVIGNSILKVLDLKTTQIDLSLKGKLITTKIIDRGTLIYQIEEPNNYESTIDDLEINLYYLNRSAKINFVKLMDIESKNYGSVFLFKNGFRVQPYGDVKDDSWSLDHRKQQGYNRFLGTRDLFGKVDITTENFNEFKEVSSRDGGLVETAGKKLLFDIFMEKAFKRLERYVVGVLWGEAFIRKKYFLNKELASIDKKELEKDKDKDLFGDALNSIGSKIDFVNLIKSLSDDENIKIIKYNKDLVNLVNEKLEDVQPKFIADLEKIAERTSDKDLLNQVKLTEDSFSKILKEKEDAIKREEEERKKRIEAEKKAELEKKKRELEEKKRKEAEEKKRKAELEAERKEKERALAELEKLKAEKKAREAEEKRLKEEKARKEAENREQKRKEQISLIKSAETIEYKDLRDSNHIIGVYSETISSKILSLKRKLDKNKIPSKDQLIDFISAINLANEKIGTITRFTTKANYLKASLHTKENIVLFIKNYVEKTYRVLHKINVEFINSGIEFTKEFKPIELTVVIDNILNNSRKKNAKKVIFDFSLLNDNLIISIKDIGEPIDKKLDSQIIFEEGVTTTRGSGLGLSHVKRIIEEELNGKIVHKPEYENGFELEITLKK